MSDSDDTDVLLLFPPDFFNADINSSKVSTVDLRDISTDDLQGICPLSQSQYSNGNDIELTNINNKLEKLEISLQQDKKLSEYSSTSSYHTKLNMPLDYKQSPPAKFYHSTPKCEHNNNDPQIIGEIDKFLKERPTEHLYRREQQSHVDSSAGKVLDNPSERNADYRTIAREAIQKHANSLQSYKIDYCNQVSSNIGGYNTNHTTQKENVQTSYGDCFSLPTQYRSSNVNQEEPLMSLSNIWGPDATTETLTHEEERIRRQVILLFLILKSFEFI